jgi:hypothetical protein
VDDVGLKGVENRGNLPGRLGRPHDAQGGLDATCQGQIPEINTRDKVTLMRSWQVA